jgi:hypothetical protein
MDECNWMLKRKKRESMIKGKETRGGTALTYQIRGSYKYLR